MFYTEKTSHILIDRKTLP